MIRRGLEYKGSPWFFDKYYENKTSLLENNNDEVMIGRYALVKYSDKFYTNAQIAEIIETQERDEDQQKWYENYDIDGGSTSYDRYVYVKTADGYVELCRLGTDPGAVFDIAITQPNQDLYDWDNKKTDKKIVSFNYGTIDNIPEKERGQILFSYDTGELFLDLSTNRYRFGLGKANGTNIEVAKTAVDSFGFGTGLKVSGIDSFVIGKYNESSLSNLFTVGSGTDANDRNTCFWIDHNGIAYVKNDVSGTADYAITNRKYVADRVSELKTNIEDIIKNKITEIIINANYTE